MAAVVVPADAYPRPTSVDQVQVSVSAGVLYNIAIIILGIIAIGTSWAAYNCTKGTSSNGIFLFLLIAVSVFLAIFILVLTVRAIQKYNKSRSVVVRREVAVPTYAGYVAA